MKYDFYEKQVRLLLKVLPIVATEKIFALKGGTAINFFIRDLPRLSVDIDLTYIPLESRELSILNINEGLSRISNKISFRFKFFRKNQCSRFKEVKCL